MAEQQTREPKSAVTIAASVIGAIATIAAAIIGVMFARSQVPVQNSTTVVVQPVVSSEKVKGSDAEGGHPLQNEPSRPTESASSAIKTRSTDRQSEAIRIRPDGVNASDWWTGDEPADAFDGNLRTHWGVRWHKARGAWIEVFFREQKLLSSVRRYKRQGDSNHQIEEATLTGDNGVRRILKFRGLDEWESVNFEPLEATTLRLEINELRKGSSGMMALYELELFGH